MQTGSTTDTAGTFRKTQSRTSPERKHTATSRFRVTWYRSSGGGGVWSRGARVSGIDRWMRAVKESRGGESLPTCRPRADFCLGVIESMLLLCFALLCLDRRTRLIERVDW
jgi:hypothetical protein